LASHLVASILGAAIGASGMIALGAVLASRGRPRAGLWVMVTGVFANVVSAAVFGVAAGRHGATVPASAGDTIPAASHSETRHDRPARVR